MLCEEWFLLTSLHFIGFARTIRLPQAETAQLLVKTASDFKSLQGFKNQWCYSICILKKAAKKQTKQMLKMYSSTLFQSISTLHSHTHLRDIIRLCQLYQYCQWLMGIAEAIRTYSKYVEKINQIKVIHIHGYLYIPL